MTAADQLAVEAAGDVRSSDVADQRARRRAGSLLVFMLIVPAPTMFLVVAFALISIVGIAHVVEPRYAWPRAVRAIVLTVVALLFVTIARSVLLGTGLRGVAGDLPDGFRFLPFIVAIVCLAPLRRSLDLTGTLAVVAVSNVLVAVPELYAPQFFRIIYQLNGSLHHYTVSLLQSSRPAGLFASPGEHGSAMALITVLLLARYLRAPKRSTGIGLLAGMASLLVSQSQTSFVAFGAAGLVLGLSQVTKLQTRSRWLAARRVGLAIITLGPLAVAFVISRLRYLVFLFIVGTNRSSYQLRQGIWADLHDDWVERPASILLGGGRVALGRERTAVVDSDLRFVLFVYGILGIVAVASLFVFAFLRGQQLVRVELLAVVAMALVASWANSFLADPRLLAVAAVVLLTGTQRPNTLKA